MRYLILAGLAACAVAGCDNFQGAIPRADGERADQASGAETNRLEADVRFLADDLLEGREAGARGYDIAATYVAERFRALGLEPGGNDGSFFQTVPMRATKNADPAGGTLSFSGPGAPKNLQPAVDYYASGFSSTPEGVIEAPLVFVGYGFVSDDYGRDDYAGLDVKGKIVVVMFGAPQFLNTEERAHYRTMAATRASEHGAIGVIYLFTPALAALIPAPDPYAAIVAMQANETSMSWLKDDGTPFTRSPNLNGGALLSPTLSERLFDNQPASWAEILAAEASEDGVIKGFDMGLTARVTHKRVHHDLASPNVLGVLPGSDPKLKDEYVVLTAHLDHEGIKPTPEEGDDEIYNGAMDNAVGVASVLDVARRLAQHPPKRSVMFIALTAEEKGLVGSDYNARHPTVPAAQIVADLNLDMPIMTYPFTDIIAFGAERSTLYPIVEAAAQKAGLALSPDPKPDEGLFVRSDQYSYVKQGVPSVFLKPGFANGGEEATAAFRKDNYHKPSDEPGLIDFDQLRRFADVNYEIARGVADMPVRPLWKKGDFFARTFNGPMEE